MQENLNAKVIKHGRIFGWKWVMCQGGIEYGEGRKSETDNQEESKYSGE